MKHPEKNFLQSHEWAVVNQKLGHETIEKDLGNGDFCLAIIKAAKRGRYLEIPGGPLIDWENQEKVEQTFADLKQIAKDHSCAFIRLRPQLEKTEENLETMKALGAHPAPFHLHAQDTVIIDLTPSEDTLLKNMRRQTRYEVRRAEKLNLKVEKSTDEAAFKEFHKIQSATAARQHFIPPTLAELLTYHEVFGDNAVIYKVTTEDGQLVALALVITYGNETDYFEAASTDLNRKLPGAYALLWRAIRDAKKQGIKRFNLWGIAPKNAPKNHRYAGVTTFKTGFGGQITEFVPAHDIVISRSKYLKTRLIETIRKKKRHL